MMDIKGLGKKKHDEKHGVYAEIPLGLFNRLVERRRMNKEFGLQLDSNYKLIEAGIVMILDNCDSIDSIIPPSSSYKEEV
jgi:hypothetical protein